MVFPHHATEEAYTVQSSLKVIFFTHERLTLEHPMLPYTTINGLYYGTLFCDKAQSTHRQKQPLPLPS
jgi:hypothetical protein